MSKFTRDYVERNPYLAADRIEELEKALSALARDCIANDFNEHWDSYKDAVLILEQEPR